MVKFCHALSREICSADRKLRAITIATRAIALMRKIPLCLVRISNVRSNMARVEVTSHALEQALLEYKTRRNDASWSVDGLSSPSLPINSAISLFRGRQTTRLEEEAQGRRRCTDRSKGATAWRYIVGY